MQRIGWTGLLMAALVFSPQTPMAKKVYSPHSEQGEIEIESQTDIVRSADPAKDGAMRQQIEIEYGVTDTWSTGLYGLASRPAGGGRLRYDGIKWENIIVLPGSNPAGFSWGAYLEYVLASSASGKPDVLEGKLLLEQAWGPWRHTANLVLKQELAGRSPASIGYAWRTRREFGKWMAALEAYGGFGPADRWKPAPEQTHLVGPVLGVEIMNELDLEVGWLVDVNRGPAWGDIKINIEIGF